MNSQSGTAVHAFRSVFLSSVTFSHDWPKMGKKSPRCGQFSLALLFTEEVVPVKFVDSVFWGLSREMCVSENRCCLWTFFQCREHRKLNPSRLYWVLGWRQKSQSLVQIKPKLSEWLGKTRGEREKGCFCFCNSDDLLSYSQLCRLSHK